MQLVTVNLDGDLIDHPPLEHSNGRDATQTSMHIQTVPNTAPKVDLNQLSKTVSYQVE